MLLRIGGLLTPHELSAIRNSLEREAEFLDGCATAGWHARDVKLNQQAAISPTLEAAFAKVRAVLLASEVFAMAALPKAFARLVVSRYAIGMAYGTHVDDAFMDGSRTDLSFTLFLSDPESYDGGELVIEDTLEAREIKLAAGELFLYPSSFLHRVEPITRGVRLAVVGWVTSKVREAAHREILFDLERALRDVHARDGKSRVFDQLVKTRTNLLRLWAEG